MSCSCNSCANTYIIIFSAGFLKQWTPPYFLSCHEQACLFEIPSLEVILEHSLRFINTMLLLTADPLLLFMLLLLSLVLALFSFSSFSHKSSFPFFSPSRLPQNLITHLFRSNNPSRRWPKVKVLLAVRGKRLLLTIHLPRPWVNRLTTSNWTA